MKLPILIFAGPLATACSSSGLISDTQPAYTHKAPYLALSCEQLRAIKSDPSTAALNDPLQILASLQPASDKQAEITQTHQAVQNTIIPDTKVLGRQQAAVWALKVNGCEQND